MIGYFYKSFFLTAVLLSAGGFTYQSDFKAEIVKSRVAPFRTAQGNDEQMLYVDWKNIGTKPIGQVKATFTTFDENGNQIAKTENYNIFVTYSDKKTIKPGKTYVEPEGDGFVLIAMPPAYKKATRADVILTKVSGIPAI